MEVVTEKPIKNNVPEGYKRTEVGVIPEDWETKTLGDLIERIVGGGTPRRNISEFWDGEIPWVTVKDFSTFDKNGTQENITEIGLKNSASNLIPKDTLITSTRMALGKAVIYDVDVAINQDLKALFTKKKLSTSFLYYWFQYNEEEIKKLGSGSTVKGISLADLKNIQFGYPPTLEEQHAIAGALSDVDALIAELDALIEKKQQVKKGAMQQLLTGKKWLPGFVDEWEEKRFDECFHFLKTGTNSRSDLSDNGGVGYIHYGDIHAKWTDVLNCDEDSIPSIQEKKVTHLPRLEEGDLILADASEDYEGVGAGIEVKNLNGRQMVAGLHTILLRAKDGCIADGYKAYITSTKKVKRSLREIATGTTVYGISKSKLKQVSILLPPTVEEQEAIAEILNDLEAQIKIIQAKREKYQKVKQGMMQELLTGKTQLV